jgi:hypothetical protein
VQKEDYPGKGEKPPHMPRRFICTEPKLLLYADDRAFRINPGKKGETKIRVLSRGLPPKKEEFEHHKTITIRTDDH